MNGCHKPMVRELGSFMHLKDLGLYGCGFSMVENSIGISENLLSDLCSWRGNPIKAVLCGWVHYNRGLCSSTESYKIAGYSALKNYKVDTVSC